MTSKATKTRRVLLPAAEWRRIRGYFVDPPEEAKELPTLHEAAARLRMSPTVAAELVRRGTEERWVEERDANVARRWWRRHGCGARTEEDFCLRYGVEVHGHLMTEGPEGYALVMAAGRETWRRVMAPLLAWDAHEELEKAREAYGAAKKRREEAEARGREQGVARRSSEAVLGW